VDPETARQYVYGDTAASLTETDDHLVIDLYADREPDDYWDETPDLGAMVDARSGLVAGDQRLLYLAWLFAVQWGEVDDDDTEPPVPSGLADLTASLDAIVDFLEIDDDLIDIAVDASPDPDGEDQGEISEWIASLPAQEKDKLLTQVASGEGALVQSLLLRRFRDSAPGQLPAADAPARTAKELRDAADAYKKEIATAVAERTRAEAARKEA
jgi:hypothetical protein